jgi:hypothetical protein
MKNMVKHFISFLPMKHESQKYIMLEYYIERKKGRLIINTYLIDFTLYLLVLLD